jgi:cytochrome c oxidase subunit 4
MSGHVVPLRVYFAVFAALMIFTALTVWAAFQDFGALNTVIALGIACVKATLVVLYFMHVRYGGRLVWVMLSAALIWLAILLVITLADYASRGWMAAAGAGP